MRVEQENYSRLIASHCKDVGFICDEKRFDFRWSKMHKPI